MNACLYQGRVGERMDYNHDKKRMNVEDDRLSRLPDELIHKILSFNGLKHAIQTSVLSSRWKFIWTSMPYLDFSRDDFSRLRKVSEFVKHVLADRNNQTEVSSVKLCFHGKHSDAFVEQIIKYAFSHGIQQLNVACLPENVVEFPPFIFSSRSLKHLTLTTEDFPPYHMGTSYSYVLKAPSNWQLPVLTTLYLHNVNLCCDENTDKCVGPFSKCANLKNLTLKNCNMEGFKVLSIDLPLLCSLTLEYVDGRMNVVNIVAPELKNLTIKCFTLRFPELSLHNLPVLEKADICVYYPRSATAHQVLRFLQALQNVKFLTLNLEVVELLSKHVELMSHQPSPFANLKRLKLHPGREVSEVREREEVEISAEVKSYLLDSSSCATFTMVSREDIRAIKNTKLAENLIAELQELLEKEKASTETKMAELHELQNTQIDNNINRCIRSYFDRCWKFLSLQIEKQKEKASNIISKLKEIKDLLEKLPASNKAIIQPSFSTLYAEADTVMNKLTDFMKMNCDENQRRLSVCFHGLATALEP